MFNYNSTCFSKNNGNFKWSKLEKWRFAGCVRKNALQASCLGLSAAYHPWHENIHNHIATSRQLEPIPGQMFQSCQTSKWDPDLQGPKPSRIHRPEAWKKLHILLMVQESGKNHRKDVYKTPVNNGKKPTVPSTGAEISSINSTPRKINMFFFQVPC